MTLPPRDPGTYIRALLKLYCDLPDTPSRPRPPDRTLARELFLREVPLQTVRQAFLLATARRRFRHPDAPPLQPVRSLYYFLPIIEELLQVPMPDTYLRYLERKLAPRK